jgi:transposase InsO family protein
MSVRRLIVEVSTEGLNVTRFCADHGVSPWTFYELRRRFAAGGFAAIEPRSRAAHLVANRTPLEVEDAIVGYRKHLVDQGLDDGPATIRVHLLADPTVDMVPSEATIWRVLDRRGFIVKDPSKAPKRSSRRFTAERANECWQFDDTGWDLADGTTVKIVDVIDDCTRVLVASHAVETATAAAVFRAVTVGGQAWGMPERVLCDNAKAHQSLHDTFALLGVDVRHPRPYHPQTCGKVERVHQTVKKWLRAHDPSATITELQHELDRFVDVYNHRRPHRGIGRRIPAELWAQTPKSGPAANPLSTPTELHRVTVNANGTIRIGSRYTISIGRAYAGHDCITAITGRACHVFIDGRAIRNLTLDPTRNYQPQQP